VSAHDDSVTETATFSNVEIAVPSLAYVPDTGYPAKVESTLETIEVDGVQSRRVVRHFDGKIEAPNWTRDGKALVYNAGGRIWRIPVEGGEPVAIPTGRNIKNNNDHGISPDGTQLVISDQSEPDNLSRIFVLPLGGSDRPREMVSDPKARSYWHGWSPDGKTLAYVRVGTDDDSYDIWAKDLAGGPARPLIAGPGVDDGPEYSPSLLQLDPQRGDGDLAGQCRRQRSGAAHPRPRAPRLVPASLARREMDRFRVVRARRRADRPSAQS
jgi:Tol biopolymer transport system component